MSAPQSGPRVALHIGSSSDHCPFLQGKPPQGIRRNIFSALGTSTKGEHRQTSWTRGATDRPRGRDEGGAGGAVTPGWLERLFTPVSWGPSQLGSSVLTDLVASNGSQIPAWTLIATSSPVDLNRAWKRSAQKLRENRLGPCGVSRPHYMRVPESG